MAPKQGLVGWWVISGESLMEMLWKTFNGEDPDMVYAEHYANSDHEEHGDGA